MVAFQGQPTDGGGVVWELYFTPGDQQQARQPGAGGSHGRAEASGGGSQRQPAQRLPAGRQPAPADGDDGMDWDRGDPIPF